jgi:ApbE superfamily uncharacterized protein (UPF0280 family)
MYQPRSYRHRLRGQGLFSFSVVVKETDLFICAASDLSRIARNLVIEQRNAIEAYIQQYPDFATSLEPLPAADDAPAIVKEMTEAATAAGVGPMAAVAGAIARAVGEGLMAYSPEVIVENGGDIYLKSLQTRTVSIYAGKSPLSQRIGIRIAADDTPLAICTSSGTVGHSLSFGKADAAVAVSRSAALADAAATAIGNRVNSADDIDPALEFSSGIEGLTGAIIIIGDRIGIRGDLEICRLDTP